MLLASDCSYELQVIVIDNASKDDSVNMLKTTFPQIQLIENTQNVGFGRANNQALPFIKGDYVLLLNTDAFVETDTIQKTVSFMEIHSETGILGVKLLGRDGVLQPSCRYFPTLTNLFIERIGLKRLFNNIQFVDNMVWNHATNRNCDWVPGCYYLVRKTMIDKVGLFDPLYFLYYEEVDHCFAAKKAGWQVTYFAGTSVVHIGGESAKSEGAISKVSRQLVSLQIESELLYFRKNHGFYGLLKYLVLQNITDCITLIKSLLKLKSPSFYKTPLQHLYMSWQLFFKTKLGAIATR